MLDILMDFRNFIGAFLLFLGVMFAFIAAKILLEHGDNKLRRTRVLVVLALVGIVGGIVVME